jgi:aquaporin Z
LNQFAGLAIGLALVLVHIVCIPITGTSVNPARSIGPALFEGGAALSQLWLFIVAPLLGAAIAAIVWRGITVEPKREVA